MDMDQLAVANEWNETEPGQKREPMLRGVGVMSATDVLIYTSLNFEDLPPEIQQRIWIKAGIYE